MPYDYSLDKSRSSYNPWFSIGARLDWCVIFGPLYLEWETLISFAFSKMWKSLLMKKTDWYSGECAIKIWFCGPHEFEIVIADHFPSLGTPQDGNCRGPHALLFYLGLPGLALDLHGPAWPSPASLARAKTSAASLGAMPSMMYQTGF